VAKVDVKLPSGSYAIHIEPHGIAQLGKRVKELFLADKALVISDDTVGTLYGETVLNLLASEGIAAELFCIPAGESSKSLDNAEKIFTKAITMGLDRHSPVLALGGGVVGDISGFIAATYLRGVPFVQVPTTLLAQVDSSVGGKVAVNHQLGKNLIGAFYQPRLVVADVDVLTTLPGRELSSGIAEVIKYGVIADQAFFAFLKARHDDIADGNKEALTEIVRRSCEIKARVVEQDEKESHLRMILNFGHTIGHAVEANTRYTKYTHGEAVAIGMYGAALISNYLGLCGASDVEELRQLIGLYRLPLKAAQCKPEELAAFLTRDKKSIGGKINWVLLDSIGQVRISNDVPQEVVLSALQELT
jgi:3-dehydroquinate synthase